MSPSRGSTATLLQAAWEYAAQEWPVLPLHPRDKTPATKHGLLDATTNVDLISAWWHYNPDFNIGLRTGVAFDALDIDGLVGIESIKEHIAGRYMHDGPVSQTGKGWHLLFQRTGGRNGANLLPKVDFRGTNGYIVAPPSVHPLGHEYRWADGRDFRQPLPVAPQWLLDLIDTTPASEPRDIPIYVTSRGDAIPLTPSAHLDILAVAAEKGIRVRKAGGLFKALCPFHKEDTPSFTLYTEGPRQSFYCFGCHAWGDSRDLQAGKPAGYR